MELKSFRLEFYKENLGFSGFGFSLLLLHVGSSSDLLLLHVGFSSDLLLAKGFHVVVIDLS